MSLLLCTNVAVCTDKHPHHEGGLKHGFMLGLSTRQPTVNFVLQNCLIPSKECVIIIIIIFLYLKSVFTSHIP